MREEVSAVQHQLTTLRVNKQREGEEQEEEEDLPLSVGPLQVATRSANPAQLHPHGDRRKGRGDYRHLLGDC